jgi:RNA polymerase sigma-70 factor (ECF subfamily)
MTSRTLVAGLAPFDADGVWDLLAPGASQRAHDAATADDVDWNALMRTHGRAVVVSLLARGIEIDRANDLAQDAWLKIIAQHRAGRFPELKMPGLVIAQADYLARDEHRRRHRRDRVEAPSPDPGAGTRDERVLERRVAAREELRRVLEVVARSYPSARRVFTLAFGPNPKAAPEIADELGLSCQRVRQILCELRQRMRTALEEER